MRQKRFLLTFLFVGALVFVPHIAHALGATGCGARYVPYEPYSVVSFSHTVINAYDYKVALEGEWNDSMVIDSQKGASVSGHLTMPPSYDHPGVVKNYVVFTEVPPPSRTGTAVAVTRVRCPIYVRVPYPGEYLEFDLTVHNINEGDTAKASYFIGSRGNQTVNDARLAITIEKNGTTLSTYSERLATIQPRAEIKNTADLTTASLAPGVYTVRGVLTYNGDKTVEVDREMRVGELDVALVNYSKTLPVADFTKLNFTVENRWNNPVKDVTISYRISNQQQTFSKVTTETFSLKPFEDKTVSSIAETPSVLEGTSFIEYTITFDGSERSGVVPVVFVRSGPDLRMLLFVLAGILVTIMAVLAVLVLRRSGADKKKRKRSSKTRRSAR